MERLSQNWLTEGLIDFEYKKYILLAYLQNVRENFSEKKLYPFLSDLLFHYRNLQSLRENKKLLYENFPKKITRADFEKLNLVYEEIINDDKIMQEIEDIISYSMPLLLEHVAEGKDLYDNIEDKMSISPVGLTPLDQQAGYVFLYIQDQPETHIFEYQVTIFERADEKYKGVHMTFKENATRSLVNTFEAIKLDLIRRYRNLPNPATFLVDSRYRLPVEETLLPIAKRMLIRHISPPIVS
jgi:hypothetical protein